MQGGKATRPAREESARSDGGGTSHSKPRARAASSAAARKPCARQPKQTGSGTTRHSNSSASTTTTTATTATAASTSKSTSSRPAAAGTGTKPTRSEKGPAATPRKSDAARKERRHVLKRPISEWNADLETLYNVQLQWLLINARAARSFSSQRADAEEKLYSATQLVAQLREEVAHQRALNERIQYENALEESVDAQYECLPQLVGSLAKLNPAYSELAQAVEATTHQLWVPGTIVPPPADLNLGLEQVEGTMGHILDAVGPQLDALSEYSRSVAGLVAVLDHELRELKTTKELLVETDVVESQRRSLLIEYIQEYGCRPDEHHRAGC